MNIPEIVVSAIIITQLAFIISNQIKSYNFLKARTKAEDPRLLKKTLSILENRNKK